MALRGSESKETLGSELERILQLALPHLFSALHGAVHCHLQLDVLHAGPRDPADAGVPLVDPHAVLHYTVHCVVHRDEAVVLRGPAIEQGRIVGDQNPPEGRVFNRPTIAVDADH
jgi:hypothetical protein